MIYLVRHGETDDNKNHIIQGNKPMNKTGKKQVKETAKILKDIEFDVCFCSPLKRTRQTAKSLLKYHRNLKTFYDDRLIERQYGEMVGLCYDTIPNYAKIRWNANEKFVGSAEQVLDFYDRIADFYDDIQSRYKGKNILIVAHSGVARMTYFYFHGKPKDNDFTDFRIKNAHIMQIENE